MAKEVKETFEAGFKWGFYVHSLGKVSRSSPYKDFRKAMSDAWRDYCGLKPKRMIGLIALQHARQNAPAEIATIAELESKRQFSSFGLDKSEPANVAQLRTWLRANPLTRKKAKSAAAGGK